MNSPLQMKKNNISCELIKNDHTAFGSLFELIKNCFRKKNNMLILFKKC